MWKKEDEVKVPVTPSPGGGSTVQPERPKRPPSASGSEQATIGRSITIRGDVTGDEDLFIQGRIEGTVDLQQHNVTVGPEGRVKANISGRTVTIEGEVDGNVRGTEQVALRSASRVHGDIVAPRVVLEDGAAFLGSIDMTGKPGPAAVSKPAPVPSTTDRTVSSGSGSGSGPGPDSKSAPQAIRTGTDKA